MFLERALEVSTAVRHMAEQTFQFKADRTRFVAWRAPRRIIGSPEIFFEPMALDCLVGAFRTLPLVALGPPRVVGYASPRYRGFARLTPATSPDVCRREAGR